MTDSGAEAKAGRPFFSPRLMRQIEAFFADHPERGDLDLTEFAQDAARFYLEHLRREEVQAEVLRLAKEGRLSAETINRLFPD